MSKKERIMMETAPQAQELNMEDEPMYETEAYASPQPVPGSDVTVVKPVGLGGPVPIVAPKHNTIQLQPIVVPLALVPYMSQDSDVLRTDGRSAQPTYDDYDEDTEFEEVESEIYKDKRRPKARLFSFITLVLSLIVTAPFVLCYFKVKFGNVGFEMFNAILILEGWINKTVAFGFRPITNWVNVIAMLTAMLTALLSLIGLFVGKYPKALICISELLCAGCFAARLFAGIYRKTFVAKNWIAFLVVLGVCLVLFILSIVFSMHLNKLDEEEERTYGKI